MFTDLSKLATDSAIRSQQLKCLMSLDTLYEYILNDPALVNLDRLDIELLDSVSHLIKDIYSPHSNL